MRQFVLFPLVCFLLAACGGGGSGGTTLSVTPLQSGGFTLLAGDMSLDGVDEVNIDIDRVVLIGAGGQEELAANNIGVINLLDLRNVTQVLALGEFPARSYSKIRLFINSLQVVESGGAIHDVQLPANGKIDLNPQGPFEINADRHLILQIDFDLERSIHLVQTGNSRYRFRPVVFIDVQENLRLTRLIGTIQDDTTGEPSDLDLCDPNNTESCYDLVLNSDALILLADGTIDALSNLERGAEANAFGHFVIAQNGTLLFETTVLALGAEDSVVQIIGEAVTSQVSGSFDLQIDSGQPATTVDLVDGAAVLDQLGDSLSGGVSAGQSVEAWAQQTVLDAAAMDVFPAFLVQAGALRSETSVSGDLLSVDGDLLTIDTPDGEICVAIGSETDIQLLTEFGSDAESMPVTLAELAERIGDGVAIEAYGEQDGDCFDAEFVAAEID